MTVTIKQPEISRRLSDFESSGYILHSLEDKQCINELRSLFEKELKKRVGQEATLETYHHFIENDDMKTKMHYELTQAFWESELLIEIFKKNQSFFKELAGLDLDVQAKPYLRLARPEKTQDNIGFHRDIEYGATAYEISCFFALTDLPAEGALHK